MQENVIIGRKALYRVFSNEHISIFQNMYRHHQFGVLRILIAQNTWRKALFISFSIGGKMMKPRFLLFSRFLLVLVVMFLLSSCDKENTKPQVKVGIVSGIVYESARAVLPGAMVTVGSRSAFTDAQGKFYLYGIDAAASVKVEFSKEGYISNQKIITVNKGLTTYVDCTLRTPLISNFSASTGSELADGNTTINIPENAFVSGSTPFTGTVKAEYRYFDPSDPNNINAFPGSFYGERLDGSTTMFESYGYFCASFTDANNPNTQLQLAPGKKASVLSYIPPSLAANAPATIPLWYYDEAAGKWREEGVGTKNGSHYQAEVAHFSYWNFDNPVTINDQSTLTGMVVTADNASPVAGAQVVANGLDYAGYTRVYTNDQGVFSITVKASSHVSLRAYLGVNSSAASASIATGASGQTVSAGNLVIEDTSFTISGKLVNTANLPIAGGHALMYQVDAADPETGLHSWLSLDANGNFVIVMGHDGTDTTVKVQFMVMAQNNLYSSQYNLTIPATGQVYNFGDIVVKEGGRIKGRAKTSSGQWLANSYVYFIKENSPGSEWNNPYSPTDAEGYFVLSGVPNSKMTNMRGSAHTEAGLLNSPLLTLNFPNSGAETNIGTVVFSPATTK